jgi:hypothetical protein
MLTRPRQRKQGWVLAALTVFLGLPGLAQAQQSGLFPLQPIRRERVPCPLEDPIYKRYRTDYYGFYPTQWRKFPDGWNLPSPEGPSSEKFNLKDHPIEALNAPMLNENEEEAPEPGAARPQPIPNAPPENERSPFEMDTPDNGAAAPRGGAVPGRRAPATRPAAPPPADDTSPFEMPDPAPNPGGLDVVPQPRTQPPGQAATAPRRPEPESPDLNPPGTAMRGPRSRRDVEPVADEESSDDQGPLLALPDSSLPPIVESGDDAVSPASVMTTPEVPVAGPMTTPSSSMQPRAPSRRGGRISALFNNLGLNWRRR